VKLWKIIYKKAITVERDGGRQTLLPSGRDFRPISEILQHIRGKTAVWAPRVDAHRNSRAPSNLSAPLAIFRLNIDFS
jgi:hypothetical protein